MGILDLVPNDDDGSTAIKHGDLNAMNVIVNDKGFSGYVLFILHKYNRALLTT